MRKVIDAAVQRYHQLEHPKGATHIIHATGVRYRHQLGTWWAFNPFRETWHTVDLTEAHVSMLEPIWPDDEERIDRIGQNGGDGLHYSFK